jgi:hypothetical protein
MPSLFDTMASLGDQRSPLEAHADVNEACISATVMEAPGVGDIVNSRSVSRNYENLKGIGQKMEVHRVAITPTQT